MDKLSKSKKAFPDLKRYVAMSEYYQKVNNAVFFIGNILDRIGELYDTFKSYPNLSARVANEIQSGKFDGEAIPTELFNKNYYSCENTDINISSYIEHRCRLAILRNVVDFILFRRINKDDPKVDQHTKLLGMSISKFDLLPQDLRDRIDLLSSDEYVHLYLSFWQWFLWIFGGIILKDYEKQDYELLSKKTGIPAKHIPRAFEAYEILFPVEGGWFNQIRTSQIKFIKLFSVPFMGNGVNYRRLNYANDGKYESLKLSPDYTRNDLEKWNDCIVNLLYG